MDTELIINKAGTYDIPVVVSLADRIWPATYRDILSTEQIAYMMQLFYLPASLRSQMEDKGHQFIIASYENEAIAFASYSPTTDSGICKVHKLYVDLKMQGRGVGRRIINYIISELNAKESYAIELNVNRNNKARFFYEKLGFRIVLEEDIDIGNGYLMNDYVMRKDATYNLSPNVT